MEVQFDVKAFDFKNNDIRVIDMGGEPWFPAKDVCNLLEISQARSSVRDVCHGKDCKAVSKSNVGSTNISFPNRGMLCLNESGLYALVFASRKPEARAFRHWVTSTVLPAIRKDGGYVMGEEKVKKSDVVSIPHTVRNSFPDSGTFYVKVDSQSLVGMFEVYVC